MQKVRLIKTQQFDAYMNMALDEVIMHGLKEKTSPPTIRFYTWSPSAISIGYFQGLHNEVDVEKCKKEKIDIVRRQTGGGAVFHQTGGEITYSVILPIDKVNKNIIESYKEITVPLIQALKNLGIDATFNPINDIIVNGKKISGNAQTRREGIFLQHGTLLFTVDVEKMFSLLTVSKEKIADKLIKSVKKRVTSIEKENKKISFEEVERALVNSFSKTFDVEIANYTIKEIKKAKKLVKEKYKTKKWNTMR